jgi:hypothetical protein
MFYFTFPVISEQVVLLNPLVFLAIALMLLILLYISSPIKEYHIEVPTELHEHSELIRSQAPYLYDAWYGQLPLWQVFWPFCVLLNVLLVGGDWLVRNTAFSVPSWDTLLLTCMTTTIWWTIATWRMSIYTRHRIWAAAARLVTLAAFLDFGFRIFIRINFPRVFFDCQGMFFDYSSCF